MLLVALFFRRLASSQMITPAATTRSAPTPTPTPIPAFAPVERPLWWVVDVTLSVDVGVAESEAFATECMLVGVADMREEEDDAGPEITLPVLSRKTPAPLRQHVSAALMPAGLVIE